MTPVDRVINVVRAAMTLAEAMSRVLRWAVSATPGTRWNLGRLRRLVALCTALADAVSFQLRRAARRRSLEAAGGRYNGVGAAGARKVTPLFLHPKKPKMLLNNSVTLEKLGEATVRDRLRGSSSDRLFVTHGPLREVCLRWLDRRKAKEACWIKVGTLAAVLAAVTGLIQMFR